MKIFSFDTSSATGRIRRDPEQYELFDLFQKNIMNTQKLSFRVYIVPREFEMRLDRISEYLYGSAEYVEELMVFNNIINPYSIKEGQLVYYCSQEDLYNLYTKDDMSDINERKRKEVINSTQSKREIRKLQDNQLLPPTVKPSNLNQVIVSKDNNIQLINSFK